MEALMPQTQEMQGRPRRRRTRAWDEDLLIVAMMIGVGLFPIVLAAVRDEGWGALPTLGMLIVLFALKQVAEQRARRARAQRRLARLRHARRS